MTSTADYMDRLQVILDGLRVTELAPVLDLLRWARVLYVAGNGGSDANASHLVLHLRELGMDAQDLLGDMPLLTALANDFAYDEVVRKRLRQHGGPADCLVVLSGSGNSRNIILALVAARARGLKTVGLLGFGGGDARGLCDVAIVFESREYGPIEDAHSVIIHILKEQLGGGGAGPAPGGSRVREPAGSTADAAGPGAPHDSPAGPPAA